MPKQRKYTANAIVYLPNDKSKEIYLIKEGKANSTYNDIETGEEISKTMGPNDFFGLISALGHFKRDETVTAVSPLTVIVFVPEEFEEVATKNTALIRKFLQHFSHKLREIGSKVNQILNQRSSVDPSYELFKIGEHYQRNEKFEQAIYAYTRYTEHYPGGELITTAKKRIQQCRKGVSTQLADSDKDNEKSISNVRNEIENEDDEKKEIAKLFYEAKSLFSEKKYEKALKMIDKIQNHENFEKYPEFKEKIRPIIGICNVELKNYSKAIKILTEFIKNNPKTEQMKSVLFYIGRGYEGLNKLNKAKDFYKKIISMKPENDPIIIKAKKRLESIT